MAAPEAGEADKSKEHEEVRETPGQTVWENRVVTRMACKKSSVVVVVNPKDSSEDKSGSS